MSNLVSVEWLQKHLNDKNIIILDATIPKVTLNSSEIEKLEIIPNTQFFDIKKKFSDVSAEFPNTFPSEVQFQKEANALGVNKDSLIVIYDQLGIYSAPRAWWLFKTFGFQNIFVLNGGLPEWQKKGYKTVSRYSETRSIGDFKTNYQPQNVVFFNTIEAISNNKTTTILDARSSARFNCKVPEPRKGLRSGAILNSLNLPFQNVLINGLFQSKKQLHTLFQTVTKNEKIVFSCGSGITASILFLAAKEAGIDRVSVYDGSWTEYGTLVEN